jgi:hypothetical protein
MGCKGSEEQRYNRYKEIAELVKELRMIGNEQSFQSPRTPTFPRFDHATLDGSTSKKDRKEAKRQAKAAERVPVITSKDIERIGKILHPEEPVDEEFEKALLMDKAIENNMYYHPATSNSREERHRFIRQERSGKSELKLSDSEMRDMLAELKVPDLAQAKSKSERVIVTRLREKIVEDFVHDHHEAGEIMMRKAGFWRWANRRTYNRLAANGRIYDWKNGETLAPVGENEVDVEGYEAPAAADDLAADHDEEVVIEKEDTDKDDDANDDMSSVVSLTSEASRVRPAYSSSASRDTSISSASRTTFSSNDESADDSWTTVGRVKQPKATLTLKLTPNGGLKHLRPNTTPRTPRTFAAAFSMLSIPDERKEYESDEKNAVSPLTPCPRRR